MGGYTYTDKTAENYLNTFFNNDISTNENGDKCAWMSLQNITLGKTYFAVQPLWSSAANGGAGGCAVHL